MIYLGVIFAQGTEHIFIFLMRKLQNAYHFIFDSYCWHISICLKIELFYYVMDLKVKCAKLLLNFIIG